MGPSGGPRAQIWTLAQIGQFDTIKTAENDKNREFLVDVTALLLYLEYICYQDTGIRYWGNRNKVKGLPGTPSRGP